MTKAPDSLTADGNLPTKFVLADLYEAQAAEIERLEKACAEWAEVSQSNYQRAKAAEAKLTKVTAAYRLEAMRRDDYSHAAFEQHLTELTG